jgi:hypothetical protein
MLGDEVETFNENPFQDNKSSDHGNAFADGGSCSVERNPSRD